MKFNVNGREVESYNLTNNEVFELYTKPATKMERDELENIIVNRFVLDLCHKQGENDDDVFVRFFSSFVNGKLDSRERVAEKMSHEHRYLQQEMFKVCLSYIQKLAKDYENGVFDGRNEWACKTSSMIVEGLKEKNWYI